MTKSQELESKGWKMIAQEVEGAEYGHVPGHQYHDVSVTIRRRGAKYRISVVETWGSAQGRDEEHGRRTVVAIESSLDLAVRVASQRAQTAEIDPRYLVQALSQAAAAAHDALDTESQRQIGDKVTEPGRSTGAGGIGEVTWTIVDVKDRPDGRFYKLEHMGATTVRPASQVESWALFAPANF